jgi:hypothetical protein
MAEATALAVATPNLFQTVNPATGEKKPAYQGRTVDQELSIAADVHRAQIAWRRTGFNERAPLMKNAAKVIRDGTRRAHRDRGTRCGSHVRKSKRPVGSPAAIRRRQEQRLRTRGVGVRHSRVLQHQDRPHRRTVGDRGLGCCPQRSIDSCRP